jgi:hypothetical protein
MLDLERKANKKSKQLAVIATKLGMQAYNTCIKAVGTCLNEKANHLLERSSKAKVGMLIATFDRPGKQAHAHQRAPGKDMSPCLLRYFLCVPVGRTINMSELDKDWQTWNVAFKPILKVTKKLDI